MRTSVSLIAVVGLVFLLVGCGEKEAPEGEVPPPQVTPKVTPPKVTPPKVTPPKVAPTKAAPMKADGVLDDAVWKGARELALTKLEFGEAANGKTRVLVAYDQDKLYLAAECSDDPVTLKNLVADATQHDADGIWNDDCVELFIDPTGKRATYYQIIINSKGVTWDGYHDSPGSPDSGWEPKYDSTVKVGTDKWVVELAIPLAAFDRTPERSKTWTFNASRTRTAAGEISFWRAPMDTSSHRPAQFGTLDGMP